MTNKILAKKRLHIYYSGSVQGIGFRYMAEKIASSLGLTGWVINLPDDRVEVMCEGKEVDIEIFLHKIADIFKGYIMDVQMQWQEARGEFDGFDVRF